VKESEEQLISVARDAVSRCNWVVGECAAKWTQRYARGRSDSDFGQLVGLSGDQIYQRRRVWDAFGDSYRNYPALKWSYFYVALNWDDAGECLRWAQDSEATVAQMRAWRRAQRGEDLFSESSEGYSEWAAPLSVDTAGLPLSRVVDPSQFTPSGNGNRAGMESRADRGGVVTMGAVARDADDSYAPFRSGAGSPPPKPKSDDPAAARQELTPEQFWKRASGMLDKFAHALTPRLLRSLNKQPDEIRDRVRKALEEIREKLDGTLD
jgi:hypothetical protein